MAVFRVERNTGYTVMSNHHLRNKELSLKAKGLLSQMLSLPEDWDYTLAGLSHINREKIDAIREAVKELEKAGYIVRSRERDEKGRLRGADYVIYEQPQPREPEAATSVGQPPILDLPALENPTLENPTLEKPTQEKPTLENPTQLNKDIQTKDPLTTDPSSTHSIPILSPNPSPAEGKAAQPPERKRKDANEAYRVYEEIIKDNISYDILKADLPYDGDRLDEIVDLILETVCTRRKTIRIAGDDYPAELVKSKFMKLDSEHIRFVSTVLGIVKDGFLFSRLGFVLPADHGILAHGLQQRLVFLHELALPQRKTLIVFQLFAQMLIHPLLQLFLNGHPQLSNVSVGLSTDGGKPCGAALLDEQVIQHLLLLITEGEKELGEKTVCCQLMQLVGTGEDDVKKISLTELTEPRQIHPEGSNLRIRHSLKLQWNIPAQVFMVTLPALPIPVQLD